MSPSNAMVKRECFEAVGMFDERLRAAEDRDQWMRIVRRFGGMLASGAVSGYRIHPEKMTSNPAHMKPNMKFLLRKTFREVPCPFSLRLRAYAHLYLDIAIVYYSIGRRARGLEHLMKSFFVWPLPLGPEARKIPMVRWVWAVKIILGRAVFEALWGVAKKCLRRT